MNKSLRTRLLWHVGLGMLVMWLLLAPWLLMTVQKEMQNTLDDRLAASAKMIMSLVTQYDLQPLIETPSALTAELALQYPEFPTSQACRIAHASGSIIAMSKNAPAMLELEPQQGYETRDYQGEGWRTFTLRQQGLEITTAERVHIRDQLMKSMVVAAAVPFTLGAIGTLILLWFGIGRQLAPLNDISKLVQKRHGQDLTARPANTAPSEIVPLVQAINDLLFRIESSLKRERRFTGDAAHELRTPLTGIKTHLQIAQMTHNQQAMHALKQAEKATDHLQRTLDQLLLLARAEEDLQLSDDIQLSVRDISELALNDLATLAKQQHITLDYHDEVDTALTLPGTLLCAGLRNVIENAIRHSSPGETVSIRSVLSQDQVVWTVRDQGPGIPQAVLDSITERFVHHGEESGSGLGLAIVEAIVQRFNGSLRFENMQPVGLKVTIAIPLDPKAETQLAE